MNSITNRKSGMTLLELMIAMGISSMLILSIAQTTSNMFTTMKTAQARQEIIEVQSMVNTYLSSNELCKRMLSNNSGNRVILAGLTSEMSSRNPATEFILNHPITSSQQILAKDNFVLGTGTNWTATSVTIIETGKLPSYTANSAVYQPVTAKINLDLRNNLASRKQSLGSAVITKTYEVSLVLKIDQVPGAVWRLDSCGAYSDGQIRGWTSPNDPSSCNWLSNSPQICPPGTYLSGINGNDYLCCKVSR